MAALRTALLLARLLLGQLILVPAWLSGADAQAGQGFQLQQPQKEVSVRVGETLTLICTVTEGGLTGPVKWLKGWGSGSETIYDQRDSSTWGVRAVNESNTDFTILIRDVRPEDNGTYYCVKFRKTATSEELYRRGDGTVVRVVQAAMSGMQRPRGRPSRAASRRTSTTPTCSPCARRRSAARAPAPTAPSTPASGQLPSDARPRHGPAGG
ncbi:signal-regulatory protein beta-1-like isoform X6 [Anas acuta]|uniref:signal-regulatory protein beta-1-like isoform X6 n=1 Tax=Anas acuta TaxID=28680 RepID=UPI0035C93B1D